MANGIYTSIELVDTIIGDLNNLPKNLIEGQYIQFCTVVAAMGQKLVALRKGITADIDSKNKTIEDLKQQLRNAGNTVDDMTTEDFVAEFTGKDVKKDGTD